MSLLPNKGADSGAIPWVWYAPVIGGYPNGIHVWMFRQFLEQGIAIAGVDVGESYGNPQGRAVFTALWEKVRRDYKFAERACLMPQSRGGLMLYNWAVENPQRVACIAGIYTVCDLRSYPGLAKACGAYGMDEAALAAHLAEHNPIGRIRTLAELGVPILHVHGDSDKVVPIERNSGELLSRYGALGGLMRLIVVPGKGHEEVPEFFQCRELADFVIAEALSVQDGPAGRFRNLLLKDYMAPLDLPRQAERAMKGFMIRNPERLPGPEGYYRTHFSCGMLPGPGLGHGRWDCGDLTSRSIMAWIALREMTGDKSTGMEVEDGQRRYLLSMLNTKTGLVFVPELVDKDKGKYQYHSWDQSRTLRALNRWYESTPADRERIKPLIERMIQGLEDFCDIHGVDEKWGPYACWSSDEFNQDHEPVPHPFDHNAYPDIGELMPDPSGVNLEGVVMYVEQTDNAKALDLAVRFANSELGQHRSEKFPPDQQRFAGFKPDGSFEGHTHSKTSTLIGIVKLSHYLADHGRPEEARRYLRAVRKTYDWIFAKDNATRGSRIGWFRERPRVIDPEVPCCTADMIELTAAMAACASLKGVDGEFGDWANIYDDMEAMTVNMIARSQIRMTPEFEAFLSTRYGDDAPAQLETARRLDGTWPTYPQANDLIMGTNGLPLSGCCQYAGVRALYAGWHSSMTFADGKLRINCFLNRRSPQATMTTEMPANGAAIIVLDADANVFVRVPGWLEPAKMRVIVDGKMIDAADQLDETKHYVDAGRLAKGARIEVRFPIEDRVEDEQIGTGHYTVKWHGNYVTGMMPDARTLPLFP